MSSFPWHLRSAMLLLAALTGFLTILLGRALFASPSGSPRLSWVQRRAYMNDLEPLELTLPLPPPTYDSDFDFGVDACSASNPTVCAADADIRDLDVLIFLSRVLRAEEDDEKGPPSAPNEEASASAKDDTPHAPPPLSKPIIRAQRVRRRRFRPTALIPWRNKRSSSTAVDARERPGHRRRRLFAEQESFWALMTLAIAL